jgi:hypothetical protein
MEKIVISDIIQNDVPKKLYNLVNSLNELEQEAIYGILKQIIDYKRLD